MKAKDELRELWCTQPYSSATKREDLVKLVQKQTKRFDRIILIRNLLECTAAAVVLVWFTLFAVRTQDTVQRVGSIVIAASAVCIIYFLLRYARGPANEDPSQNLSAYRRALLERYDTQIRLLKSVKYWYLLPPYVGLLIGSAGVLLSHARLGVVGWRDLVGPALYTAFFVFVWWLNEVKGVARLRSERARLLSIGEEANGSDCAD